MYNSSDI